MVVVHGFSAHYKYLKINPTFVSCVCMMKGWVYAACNHNTHQHTSTYHTSENKIRLE